MSKIGELPASGPESEDVRRFIEDREIWPEHVALIHELMGFPKEMSLARHNYFNLAREDSANRLRRDIALTDNPQLKRFYEIFLEIVTDYDWTVAYNLIRVLERA